jgi:hypothetical protein
MVSAPHESPGSSQSSVSITQYEYAKSRHARAIELVESIRSLDILNRVVEGKPLRPLVDALLPSRDIWIDKLAEIGEPLLFDIRPKTEELTSAEQEYRKVYGSQMSSRELANHIQQGGQLLRLTRMKASDQIHRTEIMVDALVADLHLRGDEEMARNIRADSSLAGGKALPLR